MLEKIIPDRTSRYKGSKAETSSAFRDQRDLLLDTVRRVREVPERSERWAGGYHLMQGPLGDMQGHV